MAVAKYRRVVATGGETLTKDTSKSSPNFI